MIERCIYVYISYCISQLGITNICFNKSHFHDQPYKQRISVSSCLLNDKTQDKQGDTLSVWNEWETCVSWTIAIDCQAEMIHILAHTAIKRLSQINTWLLHMQSTRRATHNNPGSKRDRRLREGKKTPPEKNPTTNKTKNEIMKLLLCQTALKRRSVSQLPAISSICSLHESDIGGWGWGGGVVVEEWPWVVTWIQWDRGEGHGKSNLAARHMSPTPCQHAFADLSGETPPPPTTPLPQAALPLSFVLSLCLWIITASHAEAPRHSGTEERAFFVKWAVCVHTELQMNCWG